MTRRIAVLGGGESGVGAAVLAKVKGMEVWLSDMGAIAPRYKQRLDEYGIDWEEGGHTEEKILAADEVVKSPGIPDSAPIMVKIINKNKVRGLTAQGITKLISKHPGTGSI